MQGACTVGREAVLLHRGPGRGMFGIEVYVRSDISIYPDKTPMRCASGSHTLAFPCRNIATKVRHASDLLHPGRTSPCECPLDSGTRDARSELALHAGVYRPGRRLS
jgi:hypothetical protein